MSKQDKKMTFTGPTAFSNIEKFQIKLLTKFVLLYIVLLYTYSALPSKKNRLFGIFLYKMVYDKK